MKNFVLLLGCIIFVACSGTDENPFIKVSDKDLTYNWEGGVQDVYVESNDEWNLTTSLPLWLSIESLSESHISLRAQANEERNGRTYNVVLSLSHCKDTIHIIQNTRERLSFVGEKNICIESGKNTFLIEVDCNVDYAITYVGKTAEWLSQMQNGNTENEGLINNINGLLGLNEKLTFSVKENTEANNRIGQVVIYNESVQLFDTLTIEQLGYNEGSYLDGEFEKISSSSIGYANLIIMGDGFTKDDLAKGGYYKKCINQAMEHFFSIEPYKSYRDYFNVYMVIAESEEEGVGEKNLFGGGSINNKFGTAYGSGTEIICNDELIFEYAHKVTELPDDKSITVLVVLNSDKYAGTAYLYQDGNSIALCPMSTQEPPNDFEGIVHHEAGGHAFGFLCDEYVYNQSEMPEERKSAIQEWQKLGFHTNLDFTDDLSKILWKDFIGIKKYAPVGAYEGGYEYQFGVWRSEENSCMNNNIPYYNVQSRWSIVKRIMELSDVEFSVQDFIANDKPVYPTDGRSLNIWKDFAPLGNPVWILK